MWLPDDGDGPCVLDGQRLVCWRDGFWDERPIGAPIQIRLP